MHGDAGEYPGLVGLDPSAAFDTVDQCNFVERLRWWVVISGLALEWFSFYLSDGSFSVTEPHQLKLSCGVPQGSVLGPICVIMLGALHGEAPAYSKSYCSPTSGIWGPLIRVCWLFFAPGSRQKGNCASEVVAHNLCFCLLLFMFLA